VEAAAISKVGYDPEPAGQWSAGQQENEALPPTEGGPNLLEKRTAPAPVPRS